MVFSRFSFTFCKNTINTGTLNSCLALCWTLIVYGTGKNGVMKNAFSFVSSSIIYLLARRWNSSKHQSRSNAHLSPLHISPMANNRVALSVCLIQIRPRLKAEEANCWSTTPHPRHCDNIHLLHANLDNVGFSTVLDWEFRFVVFRKLLLCLNLRVAM